MRAPSVEQWEIDLQLPPGWFALSCDEATDRKEVPAKVARALRSTRLAATRKGLVGALLDWSTSARELGAACAAMRWQEHPTAGLGLASLMIKLFEREPVDVDKELARLRPALSEQAPNEEFPPHIQEVQLGIGRALRVEAVREPRPVNGRPDALRLVIEHWVPIDKTDTLVRIHGSTANCRCQRCCRPQRALLARRRV